MKPPRSARIRTLRAQLGATRRWHPDRYEALYAQYQRELTIELLRSAAETFPEEFAAVAGAP